MRPLLDNVIIERIEDKLKGGIELPESSKNKSLKGKVIAVGPGKNEYGKFIHPTVIVGDMVIFSKYGLNEIQVCGKDLLSMEAKHIVLILEGEEND